MSKITLRDIKKPVLTRVPPGDRWTDDDEDTQVFPSLTEGLEHAFQTTGISTFQIDAQAGVVYTIESVEVNAPPPPAPKKFSLYGEDY
jgi:hypothetical protein